MRNEMRTVISAALIAFLISCGGIACMVTGMDFEKYKMLTVVLFCLLFSLITGVIAGAKHSIWVVLAGALLLIGVFARQQTVNSFRFLLQSLTKIYDMAYGCGVYAEDYGYLWSGNLTWALCIVAGCVITAVVWTVHKRFTAIPAVVLGILPLASCLVVTDTVPDSWAIFLLLTGLVLLILTHSVRRRSAWEGNRLTALLLIPVCLMNLLLFWVIPRDGYTVGTGKLEQKIVAWLQGLPFAPDPPGTTVVPSGPVILQGVEVELDEIGRNYLSDAPVMNITAENGGMLYLRGQAYDVYTGKSWQVRKDLEGGDLGWPTKDLLTVQTLEIQTIAPLPIRHFPYYIGRDSWLEDYENGRLLIPIGQNQGYIFTQAQPGPGGGLTEEDRLTDALYEHYTALPEDTLRQAQVILSGTELEDSLSVEEKAAMIADYVRQSATYDLMTDRMPIEKEDFAIWFLEEGTTGYCVHFATAATVLLRAAGIPARYVTGYLAYLNAGIKDTVYANQAHAWVEYYDPTEGWRYLEPTPGDGLPDAPADPNPPEFTDPVATTEPEDTGNPSDPSLPDGRPMQTLPSKPGATEDSAGSGGPGSGQTGEPDRTWLWTSLKVLSGTAGAAAVLWLQFWARRRWRQVKMHSGHPNKRCIARWREVLRFCRILKRKPPEELMLLAEKAKFSQHRIAPEELKCFDSWLRQAKSQVKAKKLGFLYRIFWAV